MATRGVTRGKKVTRFATRPTHSARDPPVFHHQLKPVLKGPPLARYHNTDQSHLQITGLSQQSVLKSSAHPFRDFHQSRTLTSQDNLMQSFSVQPNQDQSFVKTTYSENPAQIRPRSQSRHGEPLSISRIGLSTRSPSASLNQRHQKCLEKHNMGVLSVLKRSSEPREKKQRSSSGDLIKQEYVGNLQKQIYFLELEHKLLKDKEDQMANLEGNKQPIDEYLHSIKFKYSDFQHKKQVEIESQESDYRKLFIQHYMCQSLIEQLTKEHAQNYERYRKENSQNKLDLERLHQKQVQQEKFNEDIRRKLIEIRKQRDLAKTWADEQRTRADKQDYNLNRQKNKLHELQKEKQEKINKKNIQIMELQQKISHLQNQLDSDPGIQNAKKQISQINDVITQATQDRQKYLLRTKKLQFSKDILQRNSSQISNQKKNILLQIQQIQSELDREHLSQEALIRKKMRQRDNKDLKMLVRSIEDSRREGHMNMDQFKQKQSEQALLTDQLKQISEQYEFFLAQLSSLQTDYEKMNNFMFSLQKQTEESENQLDQILNVYSRFSADREKLTGQKRRYGENCAQLRSEILYYQKQIESEDHLKSFDLESFKKLSYSNNKVNESIHQLVNQWDGMQYYNK